MSQSAIRFVAFGVAASFIGASIVSAGAKDDAALAKAPAAVQAGAKRELGSKKLEEFAKESVGGKTLYEIGFKVGSVDHAYILDEAGKLVQEEADVEVSKLPSAVVEAVKKAQPKGKIDEAADATAGDQHFYEIDVKVDNETHALKISKDGKLIADEIEKAAEDEKD